VTKGVYWLAEICENITVFVVKAKMITMSRIILCMRTGIVGLGKEGLLLGNKQID